MSVRLSAAALLEIWEQGSGLHVVDQALLVLRYACADTPYESLATLSIGQRDSLLMKVRQATFGDKIEAYIECPHCQERLEFTLPCDALGSHSREERQTTKTIVCEGMKFHIRCPDSRDMAKVATSQHVSEAKQILFTRCVTPTDTTKYVFQELPGTVQTALVDELASLDPQAEMLINLACPSCEHTWQGLFDIVSFFWIEIQVKARRLLQEIDVLARTYGWAETDILHMTNTRRALYRDMALS